MRVNKRINNILTKCEVVPLDNDSGVDIQNMVDDIRIHYSLCSNSSNKEHIYFVIFLHKKSQCEVNKHYYLHKNGQNDVNLSNTNIKGISAALTTW